jgi:hypothetical protein
MPEVQTTGDTKNLPKNPQSEVPSGRVSGGQTQIIGDHIKLSRTPVSSAPKLGLDSRVQTVAESVTLGTTPIKGLGSSASIPMSERAVKQSK